MSTITSGLHLFVEQASFHVGNSFFPEIIQFLPPLLAFGKKKLVADEDDLQRTPAYFRAY
jgi:hypothetical protein